MRNLKRALSLALASVMLLGMMVVGAGAASYPDVSSEDNVEAIEVLNAVKVMVGKKGNFDPDAPVNRHEMAVIMAKLYLGSEAADNYVGTHPFTDVYPWADKYVAACYENGLISGTSKTTYGGNQPLTAIQAAAMMLRALGYEDLSKGAADWRTPVAAKANQIRLFKDVVSNPSAQLTRNQVAQLALNTLKADVVETERGADVTIGDVAISTSIKYNRVELKSETTVTNYSNDDTGKGYQQLCEKLYDQELKLASGVPDAMGRPGIQWSYKNDIVGTYATGADRVIVVDKAQTLLKELEDANKNWKTSWTEGQTPKTTKVKLNGANGDISDSVNVGDVLEIYMDNSAANAVGTVAIIRYSVDEVTGSVVTKGSGDDLQVRIPGFVGYTDADKLNGDYNALEKDDVIYYYRDNDGVYTFALADSFEGTYSGDKTGTPIKHIIGGSDYIANGSVGALSLTKQTTYAFYTDANGYLIAAKEIEEAASDYVVIQDIKYANGTGGITGSRAVEARLVRMDGTVEVVKVKSVDVNGTVYSGIVDTSTGSDLVVVTGNAGTIASAVTALVCDGTGTTPSFFTYSVNSDKEYELTQVVSVPADNLTVGVINAANTIGNGKPEITSSVAVNKNTVFVVATEDGGKSFKVYNGNGEVPDITAKAQGGAYVAENGIATYVYVGHWSASSMAGGGVFFLKATEDATLSEKDGDTTIYYNTYKAVVEGKYELVKVKAGSNGVVSINIGGSPATAIPSTLALYTPTYDSNGVITALTTKSGVAENVATGYKLDGSTLVAGSSNFTCDDDALVFIMDEDGNVTEGAAADISEDKNDSIYVVKTNATDKVVDFLFIIEKADDDTSLSALSANNDLTLANVLEQTVQGKASTAYTITATANGAGATVEFSTDSGANWAAANGTTNKVTTNAQDGADVSIWVRVTTVDGSEAIYKITIMSTKSA